MNSQQDRSIIPIPSQELAGSQIGGNRILGQMVDELLALGRVVADVEIPRFRIGDYTWCEAEYRQILLWAAALNESPSGIVEQLIAGSESTAKTPTHFEDGRIFALLWCRDWLPTKALASLALPNLTALDCFFNGLTEINLFSVPHLTKLYCICNCLTEIDLSRVPNLTLLDCSGNEGLMQLDLSNTPKLSTLKCGTTRLTKLNLSHTPNLSELGIAWTGVTELDLSLVPNLKALRCNGTQLTELDIRPLRNLRQLDYDSDKTRLIQRPDQNF